ncbi:MAG: suppressor of fused domain protein [Oscillibacter sp.]|nr:suppressor of fused domain protein [Oscillibacter sp.]
MGFLDRLRRKKPETAETPEAPAKKHSGPETAEYSPGGSPIYRYEDHEEAGFQPPAETGVYAEQINAYFAEQFPDRGGFVYHEIVSDLVHIDVHILRPNGKGNFYVLYTTGMSDLPMTLPEDIAGREDLKYGELFMFLPGDWNVGEEAQSPSDLPYECLWPVSLLKFLARFPHEYKTWLGFGHTMPNGPDYAPICDGVGFGGVVLSWMGSDLGQVETEDGHNVLLYHVIPAYKEEIEYKLKYGMEGLEERFAENHMPLVLDVHRPNYCADFTEVLD